MWHAAQPNEVRKRVPVSGLSHVNAIQKGAFGHGRRLSSSSYPTTQPNTHTCQYTSHDKHTRNTAAEKRRATTMCSRNHLYKINIEGALRNINGTDRAYREWWCTPWNGHRNRMCFSTRRRRRWIKRRWWIVWWQCAPCVVVVETLANVEIIRRASSHPL